ncbi:MAG: zinc ribbon domain-containing protein [Planctomycetota bacterium]
MPTYVYETIPESEREEALEFEIVQRMADEPLTRHPETGQPVRRIISGGLSLPVSSKKGSCCSSSCSCG